MKRAIVIRHVAFEDLGSIAGLLREREYGVIHYEAGVSNLGIPNLDASDLLIVLGGPIGAYEATLYPFLLEEQRLIERALRLGCPILGICLGAQLLAQVLGARVYPGIAKEIGIAAIKLTAEGHTSCLHNLAPDFNVLHWHGDTFDLPNGATCLASSQVTPNQAFSVGPNVLGLQFHIEAEAAQIERWLIGHACELSIAEINRPALRADLAARLPGIENRGGLAIAEWLDGIVRPDGMRASPGAVGVI